MDKSDIEHEGFLIAKLTEDKLNQAFENFPEFNEKVLSLGEEFGEEIRPELGVALQRKDVEGTKKSLLRWRENNAGFLEIAHPVYAELLHLNVKSYAASA